MNEGYRYKMSKSFIATLTISIALIIIGLVLEILEVLKLEGVLISLIGVFGLIDCLNTERLLMAIKKEHELTREKLRRK